MKNIKNSTGSEFLRVMKDLFEKYKGMGDKTFAQLDEPDFNYKIDSESNSISVLIRHLNGNMVSRFSAFLTSDGEKENRNRDAEFEDSKLGKNELIRAWESGWKILIEAVDKLREEDLLKEIKIRNETLSVVEALNRQATHVAYHVGQIVFIAKHLKKDNWKTLSVPKKKS